MIHYLGLVLTMIGMNWFVFFPPPESLSKRMNFKDVGRAGRSSKFSFSRNPRVKIGLKIAKKVKVEHFIIHLRKWKTRFWTHDEESSFPFEP